VLGSKTIGQECSCQQRNQKTNWWIIKYNVLCWSKWDCWSYIIDNKRSTFIILVDPFLFNLPLYINIASNLMMWSNLSYSFIDKLNMNIRSPYYSAFLSQYSIFCALEHNTYFHSWQTCFPLAIRLQDWILYIFGESQ